MKLRFRILGIAAVIGALLGISTSAQAAATLSLSAVDDSSYQLQGTDLEGVAALDIILSYDASVLTGPRVTQGILLSGALAAVNSNISGMIHIGVVRTTPIGGSGPLFTFAFTRKDEGQGIRTMAARLTDLTGKPLVSQIQMALGPETTESDNQYRSQTTLETPASAGTSAASPSPALVIGLVAPQPLPKTDGLSEKQEQRQTVDAGPPELQAASQPNEPMPASRNASASDAKSKFLYTQLSILDQFRSYRGERTPRALMALFNREPLIGFGQEPAVALSDGATPVMVWFISTPEWKRTKDIACMGASILSIERDLDATNTWIVHVLPEKGTDSASLSVLQNGLLMIYPITVAPKITINPGSPGGVSEADFRAYLHNQDIPALLKRDLNKDGARDWRDDYIFTANYLVEHVKHKSSAISSRQSLQGSRE